MTNSYGFNGDVPDTAIAGMYDYLNGEWTGAFYFSVAEAEAAEKEILDNDAYGLEEVDQSDWDE